MVRQVKLYGSSLLGPWSMVGADEATIRRYIRHQEDADRKDDGPRLFN